MISKKGYFGIEINQTQFIPLIKIRPSLNKIEMDVNVIRENLLYLIKKYKQYLENGEQLLEYLVIAGIVLSKIYDNNDMPIKICEINPNDIYYTLILETILSANSSLSNVYVIGEAEINKSIEAELAHKLKYSRIENQVQLTHYMTVPHMNLIKKNEFDIVLVHKANNYDETYKNIINAIKLVKSNGIIIGDSFEGLSHKKKNQQVSEEEVMQEEYKLEIREILKQLFDEEYCELNPTGLWKKVINDSDRIITLCYKDKFSVVPLISKEIDEYEKVTALLKEKEELNEKIDLCGVGIDYLDRIKKVCIERQDKENLIHLKQLCVKQHEILISWVNGLLMNNTYLDEKYANKFKRTYNDFIKEVRSELVKLALE